MSPPDRGCIRQQLPRRTRMVTSTHGPRSDSTSKKAHHRTVRILGASISSVNSIAREYAHHMPAAAADLIRSDRLRADRGRMHQPSSPLASRSTACVMCMLHRQACASNRSRTCAMCGIRIVAARHAAALDANAAAAAAASSMNAEQHRGSREWAAPLSRRSHCVPATDRRKR